MTHKTYETYKKYIKPNIINNKNIDPKIFFKHLINLINDSILTNEEQIIKKDKFIIIDKNELSGICDFIKNIYIDVYHFLGYNDYYENLWILNIQRNVKNNQINL